MKKVAQYLAARVLNSKCSQNILSLTESNNKMGKKTDNYEHCVLYLTAAWNLKTCLKNEWMYSGCRKRPFLTFPPTSDLVRQPPEHNTCAWLHLCMCVTVCVHAMCPHAVLRLPRLQLPVERVPIATCSSSQSQSPALDKAAPARDCIMEIRVKDWQRGRGRWRETGFDGSSEASGKGN